MRRVRWAVIGSGGIARRRTIPEGLAPAANAQLVAVYDTGARVNQEVAAQFGAHAAPDLASLLRQDCDAVYIATPNHLHCEQALACFAAGKHVLCEKPLGLSVSQARRMAAAADAAGLILGTAFMMRFQAQHQAALAFIQEGRLGRPVLARAQLSCWYPPAPGAWRQSKETGGGGSLLDMGGHTIDLLEMFFGPVRQVECVTGNLVQPYEAEDAAVALLRFEGGALGVIDAFFCIPDAASLNALELYGSRGCILASGTIGQGSRGRMVARLQPAEAAYDARQQRDSGGEIVIDPEPVNTYRAEIEEFSQAILDGRPPVISAALGLRSQQILDACYESARTRRAVLAGA